MGTVSFLEAMLLGGHKSKEDMALLRRLREGTESLITMNEAFVLLGLARRQSLLGGAFAEVGVYQGSSARILAHAKGERQLLLFDTFAGLPEPSAEDLGSVSFRQFAAGHEWIAGLQERYRNITAYPGLFPLSATSVPRMEFSLVHLDVDLYQSTKDALAYFYPRLVSGGVIITHDYSLLPGVKSAFSEFFAENEATVIELPTTQALAVKSVSAA